MIFILFLVLFYKKAKREAIEVNSTSVCLEILNHILNGLNKSFSKEVNFKGYKSLCVANEFLCNNLLLSKSIKYLNPLYGKVFLLIWPL